MTRKQLISFAAAIVALATAITPVSAQQIEEGQWLNLFDGESLFGWTLFGDAAWTVTDGVLTAKQGTNGWLASTCQFADFDLTVKIRVTGKGSAGIAVRSGLEGHPADTGGAAIALPAQDGDAWHVVQVRAVGTALAATVDGQPVEGLAATRARGYVGIQYHRYHRDGRAAPAVEVSEVKLRPLHLAPIFNGANLDGWNIIPDRASVFSVVDGALNIKDGNGQIETAGVYQDFLLQLDIAAFGDPKKPLNSGVFFRGPVGVFWKGYESQVRNEFVRDDRTRPVDFGTGGLYGIQEARKVLPSEGEWFQKTIICEGNHFAVWINGYLVSDYFDTRPVSAEGDGKSGFVQPAGTIHLQGHDPTTNLSFKNINIQEYPAR